MNEKIKNLSEERNVKVSLEIPKKAYLFFCDYSKIAGISVDELLASEIVSTAECLADSLSGGPHLSREQIFKKYGLEDLHNWHK